MAEELFPAFPYFPHPRREGSVQRYDAPCSCCGLARGYIVEPPYYGEAEVEALCPWCVASGEAAQRFGLRYNDATELQEAGVDEETIEEIETRTPGIQSWQDWFWPAHCKDAGVYLGEVDGDTLLDTLTPEQVAACVAGVQRFLPGFTEADLRGLRRGGQPAVYVFECPRCEEILPMADYT